MILVISIFLPISPTLANPNLNPVKDKLTIVSLTGTIHKLAIENTCYQLATDDGKKYELIGKFPKIEGTRVQVRGIIATDTVTICQVGQLVKVKSVRVIK
ncbi:MAG: hypothetical protein LH474_04295 [Chamaesiphon sp.]|nr:hypothetical protein [Chamaesiphon sp.]